jgi:hypothetical protein
METKAFENVKNQIGRCGIWCGSCAVGNGTLRDLAKRSEHLIGGYGMHACIDTDYDPFRFNQIEDSKRLNSKHTTVKGLSH